MVKAKDKDTEKFYEILKEIGISKVKLAKFLGVSRQMVYNYLDLDSISKWPSDKKFLMLNLLGIKSIDELKKIKVNTDYIMDVETRINNLYQVSSKPEIVDNSNIFGGLGKEQKELLNNLINIIKDSLEDEKDMDSFFAYKYLYNFLQYMSSSKDAKYILAYVGKSAGFISPMEFKFDEEQQFIFESIMYSAMTLYKSGKASKSKLVESHKRFEEELENKKEELMSRTMELNSIKLQALKELGYDEINERNASEVFEKIAEIQSRKNAN